MQNCTSFQHRTTALFLQRQQPNWRHIYDVTDLVEISPHLSVLTTKTRDKWHKNQQQIVACKYHGKCKTLLTHQRHSDIILRAFSRSLHNCKLGAPRRRIRSILFLYTNKLEDWQPNILHRSTQCLESTANWLKTRALNYIWSVFLPCWRQPMHRLNDYGIRPYS